MHVQVLDPRTVYSLQLVHAQSFYYHDCQHVNEWNKHCTHLRNIKYTYLYAFIELMFLWRTHEDGVNASITLNVVIKCYMNEVIWFMQFMKVELLVVVIAVVEWACVHADVILWKSPSLRFSNLRFSKYIEFSNFLKIFESQISWKCWDLRMVEF